MIRPVEISAKVEQLVAELPAVKKVLLVHPDYSRHDFSHLVAPVLARCLARRGEVQIDTLNAAGTHPPMSELALSGKLGLWRDPLPGGVHALYNHAFGDPSELVQLGTIPAELVQQETAGFVQEAIPVMINRLVPDYDLVVLLTGTVPHEAAGFSGGAKGAIPGIAGRDVVGLFHWASVMAGLPNIIGRVNNPARRIINEGVRQMMGACPQTTFVSLNMVYSEDERKRVIPEALFTGVGYEGVLSAFAEAARLSAELHIIYLDEPVQRAVQVMPEMYDEVWTAGKGSYKLQLPGVLAEGAEIILYAPHIHKFHSQEGMDRAIRQIGYHGRDYVEKFVRENPGFDLNVAAHVINVRGYGEMVNGEERFPFRVSLATAIPQAECEAVGLGYRDPRTIRREDFCEQGDLWIPQGGQWLYAKKGFSPEA